MTLPAYAYGDPADIVEQQELRELGCRACEFHVIHFGKVACCNAKVVNHKKVPSIGSNCKHFELKG